MRGSVPLLTLGLVLGSCASGTRSATVAPASRPAADTGAVAVLRLEPYLGGLVTAPVKVGNHELPFVFDTGGGITVYTPEAARAAGFESFGRVTGFRHDGERIDGARCTPSPLVVDGWRAPAHETGVFDLMALLPPGVPILGGLLSLRTFDGLPVTLDLSAGRVIVESDSSLQARVNGMTEVPMRRARQGGGSMLDVFLPFRADGGPIWMELDSGNTGPVYIAPHAAAQLGLDLSDDEDRTVTLDMEGFGPVEVLARPREMIYDGLLNAELLGSLRITLDLGEGRAWVQRVRARSG